MRVAALLFALSLTLLLCVAAICQDDMPAPPPPPPPAPGHAAPAPTQTATPWLMQRGNPYVIVGPADASSKPRTIRGKVSIICKPATGARVMSVAIQVDDKPVGSAGGDRMGLYGLDFDSSSLSEGIHTVKAIGADASGQQAWVATTKVDVRNKQTASPATPAPTAAAPAAPVFSRPMPVVASKPIPASMSPKPTASAKTPQAGLVARPVATAKPIKPAAPVAPGKTYASANYGFSVKLPAGWTAKDKTAVMKPQKAGNGWIEFSSAKDKALVMNVRRMRLEPKTTADQFAKFNPYLTKWDRKTVLGAQAFGTNTDAGNGVIHRLIIIKNGYAWMLNCVDGNGKTSVEGQKLFDSMVASFKLSAKAAIKPTAKTPAKSAKTVAKPAKKAVKVAPKPIAKTVQPVAKVSVTPTAKPKAKPGVKPTPKPAAKPAAATAPKSSKALKLGPPIPDPRETTGVVRR